MATSPSSSHQVTTWPKSFSMLTGLLLTGALGLVSMWLGQQPWFMANGLSPLTIAIVLGMICGHTFYPSVQSHTSAGVDFSKTRLLRTGIVLYGLRLTFQDIAQVGVTGVVIDALMLGSTFAIACFLGMRLFKMDRHTTLLIGTGASICGAAAVMAAEPIVKGRAEHVTVAIATVVIFGTIAMFLWPVLYNLFFQKGWLAMDAQQYGVFVGSTVHEVAQVVVAGRAAGEEAAGAAVISKMVRVIMLAPFLMLLAWGLLRYERKHNPQAEQSGKKIVIPWFALGFILVIAIHSTSVLPRAVVENGIVLDNLLLAMAMGALGLSTHVSVLRRAGIRPLLLALMLFGWLLGGGLLINLGVHSLLG